MNIGKILANKKMKINIYDIRVKLYIKCIYVSLLFIKCEYFEIELHIDVYFLPKDWSKWENLNTI